MEKDIMMGKVGCRRRRGRQRMRLMEGILTETGNGLKELRELWRVDMSGEPSFIGSPRADKG